MPLIVQIKKTNIYLLYEKNKLNYPSYLLNN